MSRILIVEDEVAIADLIRLHLKHGGHEVVVCHDADAAQRVVAEALPDLVVLDWMLPGTSGIALARHWRQHERTRDLPVIMLTAKTQETEKITGLDAGADDYLTKPFSPQELLARIRAVLRRRKPQASEEVLRAGGLQLDPHAREIRSVPPAGEPDHTTLTESEQGQDAPVTVRLGPTEFKLLHVLMAHAGRVFSRAQLLDQVWGDHVFIEERTVDVHIKRLREALRPLHGEGLIDTVRGAGYRFFPEGAHDAGRAGAVSGPVRQQARLG